MSNCPICCMYKKNVRNPSCVLSGRARTYTREKDVCVGCLGTRSSEKGRREVKASRLRERSFSSFPCRGNVPQQVYILPTTRDPPLFPSFLLGGAATTYRRLSWLREGVPTFNFKEDFYRRKSWNCRRMHTYNGSILHTKHKTILRFSRKAFSPTKMDYFGTSGNHPAANGELSDLSYPLDSAAHAAPLPRNALLAHQSL